MNSIEEQTRIVADLVRRGFGHKPQEGAVATLGGETKLSRETYANMYGPTTGDRVRLGDTELWVEVEHDMTVYGDELKFGGGKVIREGMGQATGLPDAETLDCIITNALIIDWSGIYKVRQSFPRRKPFSDLTS